MGKRNKIAEGLRSAISFTQGNAEKGRLTRYNVPEDVDVKAIRQGLGLSQQEFALRFGFCLGTLRHWEQGARYPEGSARVLLTVIAHNPEAVQEAVRIVTQRTAVSVG